MKYKKRSREDIAARRAAREIGLIHYEGDECDECKQTVKYTMSGKCVPCLLEKQVEKNKAKNPDAKPTRQRIHELNPLTDQEKWMAAMLRQWRIVPSDYNAPGDYTEVAA